MFPDDPSHSLLDCGEAFKLAQLNKEWVSRFSHTDIIVGPARRIILPNPNRITLYIAINDDPVFNSFLTIWPETQDTNIFTFLGMKLRTQGTSYIKFTIEDDKSLCTGGWFAAAPAGIVCVSMFEVIYRGNPTCCSTLDHNRLLDCEDDQCAP